MDAILRQTAEDHRLSRSERRALRRIVEEDGLSDAELARFRRRAFAVAHELAEGLPTGGLLSWLEDTVKALLPSAETRRAEVHFSPGEDCLRALLSNLRNAQTSVDICVFTITDDRIAAAILEAHTRGVAVRIISDDAKTLDLGSDVDRLAAAGVPVRMDRGEGHMHHKFALFDAGTLATGSYNWTRSAARSNQENLLLTDDPRLLRRFAATFERLWSEYEPS